VDRAQFPVPGKRCNHREIRRADMLAIGVTHQLVPAPRLVTEMYAAMRLVLPGPDAGRRLIAVELYPLSRPHGPRHARLHRKLRPAKHG